MFHNVKEQGQIRSYTKFKSILFLDLFIGGNISLSNSVTLLQDLLFLPAKGWAGQPQSRSRHLSDPYAWPYPGETLTFTL